MPKPKYDHPVIQKGAVQVFAHLARKTMSTDLCQVKETSYCAVHITRYGALCPGGLQLECCRVLLSKNLRRHARYFVHVTCAELLLSLDFCMLMGGCIRWLSRLVYLSRQNLEAMLTKTPDLIEAMIELACSRRWLQTTIYVIEFSQHVLHGLWAKDSSLLMVHYCASAVFFRYAVATSYGTGRVVPSLGFCVCTRMLGVRFMPVLELLTAHHRVGGLSRWGGVGHAFVTGCTFCIYVAVAILVCVLCVSCSFASQLPHIGESEVKAISNASVAGMPPVKGIAQYIKLPREERKVGQI